MDGTLAQSEALHLQTLINVLKHHGVEAGDELHASIFGKTGREVHAWSCDRFGMDFDFEQWSMFRARDYVRAAQFLQPRPGALDVFRAAKRAGIAQAIVSNSTRMLLEANLRALGLEDPQLVTISVNDVRCGKPAPEPYERAAWLLRVAPAESIVIEDSPTGARAALAAGMRVLAWPEEGGADHAFPEGVQLIQSESELAAALGLH